jgi:hypothetical protein
MRRATTSVAPPAGNGTTIVITLAGYCSAGLGVAVASPNATRRKTRKDLAIFVLLDLAAALWPSFGADTMRERSGWRNVLTNSANLANIIGGYRYHPIFRRTRDCVEVAVAGRLPS